MLPSVSVQNPAWDRLSLSPLTGTSLPKGAAAIWVMEGQVRAKARSLCSLLHCNIVRGRLIAPLPFPCPTIAMPFARGSYASHALQRVARITLKDAIGLEVPHTVT